MAEIRVEPRNNNNNRSIWPWILGALLLIGLIWGISSLSDDDEREIEATRTETTIDNGEVAPVESEPVRNESYEEDQMRTDDQLQDESVLEEDTELQNDRVREDGVLENQ